MNFSIRISSPTSLVELILSVNGDHMASRGLELIAGGGLAGEYLVIDDVRGDAAVGWGRIEANRSGSGDGDFSKLCCRADVTDYSLGLEAGNGVGDGGTASQDDAACATADDGRDDDIAVLVGIEGMTIDVERGVGLITGVAMARTGTVTIDG